MKLLHIGNADLARLLQVDVSLVSKWRSGTRNIESSPEYLKRMISYAVQLDKKNHYEHIRSLLAEDYNISSSAGTSEYELYLRDWFLNDRQQSVLEEIAQRMMRSPAMCSVPQMLYWEGNAGRREAVMYFTEYAAACSPGMEIISYTTESGSWFSEDPAFLQNWQDAIQDFLRKGNSLKIVHPVDRHFTALVHSMLQWMPLHMAQDVHGYFLKEYADDATGRFTVIVCPGKMVVCGISGRAAERHCRTWTSTDPQIVGALSAVAKNAVDRSHPLFRKFSIGTEPREEEALAESLIRVFQNGMPCFFYNDLLGIVPTTEEARRTLLRANGVPAETESRLLDELQRLDMRRNTCTEYFLFDPVFLEKQLTFDSILLGQLSILAGMRVSIPQDLFRIYLQDFVRGAKAHPRRRIGIVGPDVGEQFGHMGLLVGGNNTKCFFLNYETLNAEVLEIMEYSISASFLRELERIWNEIPYLKKDVEYLEAHFLDPLLN